MHSPSRPPATVPPSPPDWYDPDVRVPRRDQVVRVHTATGVDHVAQFVVHHTDDWPSGAAWSLGNGHAWLPFTDVEAWSPDPQAHPPAAAPPPSAPSNALDPDARGSEPDAPSAPNRPALSAEIEAELRRTRAVLALLPPDHMDWSPHPSLPTLRVLAGRLVRIVARIGWMLEFDEVEMAFEPSVSDLDAVNDLVAAFDANEREVLTLLDGVDADALRAPWRLDHHGEPVARMTRGGALRELGLTPIVYHRGEAALMLTALGIRPPHPYPVWAFDDAAPQPDPVQTDPVQTDPA